jgi:hypothetical protein
LAPPVVLETGGVWSIGHISWGHSDIGRMRKWGRRYQDNIAAIHRQLRPSEPPRPDDPEKIYQWSMERGDPVEELQRKEVCRKLNAD